MRFSYIFVGNFYKKTILFLAALLTYENTAVINLNYAENAIYGDQKAVKRPNTCSLIHTFDFIKAFLFRPFLSKLRTKEIQITYLFHICTREYLNW